MDTAGDRRWVERHDYVVRAFSRAPADSVYDFLADLPSHLEWSGSRLGEKAERLVALSASAVPATVGTVFESTGYTPVGTFRDRSLITAAMRPERFEFQTESVLELKDGTPVTSTWTHRFILELVEGGTWITRTDRQTRFYHPAPWWVRVLVVPPIALVGYRLMARPTALATLQNLAAMAEQAASPAAGDHTSTDPTAKGRTSRTVAGAGPGA